MHVCTYMHVCRMSIGCLWVLRISFLRLFHVKNVIRHKKNETNPIAQEPRVGGERQTDGYRTCSDLSQCYKAQLDRCTEYKWTHLQI